MYFTNKNSAVAQVYYGEAVEKKEASAQEIADALIKSIYDYLKEVKENIQTRNGNRTFKNSNGATIKYAVSDPTLWYFTVKVPKNDVPAIAMSSYSSVANILNKHYSASWNNVDINIRNSNGYVLVNFEGVCKNKSSLLAFRKG